MSAVQLQAHVDALSEHLSNGPGEVVSQEELPRVFSRFLLARYGGSRSMLVAIDGKKMCGTIPAGETDGRHLLVAYLPAEGVMFAQVAVESKGDDIVAVPRLPGQVGLKNRVVCGDA